MSSVTRRRDAVVLKTFTAQKDAIVKRVDVPGAVGVRVAGGQVESQLFLRLHLGHFLLQR